MLAIMSKKNLYLRVGILFVLGILFGLACPSAAVKVKWVGDLWMNGIRMLIIPIVFCSVVGGIAHLENAATLKRLGGKVVLVYVFFTFASCVLAVAVASLLQPGVGAAFENIPALTTQITQIDLLGFFKNLAPSNMIAAMAAGNTMQVIFVAICCGVAVVLVGEPAASFKNGVIAFLKVIYKIIDGVMALSPIGVFCLMAHATAFYGPQLFTSLAKFIGTIWVACFLIILLVFTLPVVCYCKVGFGTWFKSLIPILLMTTATNSSAATIPTTLSVAENTYRVPVKLTGFSIPLGATINLSGGACFTTIFAIFVAQFYQVHLGLEQLAYICVLSTIVAIAAPGIAGGGIVLGPLFLSMVGLPVELGGLLGGFYRLIDTAHTAANVVGDVAGTLVVAKNEKMWDVSMMDGGKKD